MARPKPWRIKPVMSEYFIGLMSGTSMDGVDAALVEFYDQEAFQDQVALRLIGHAALPYPPGLRAALLQLQTPGHDELHRAAMLGQQLAGLYANAAREVLRVSGISADQVRAIGCHGQTVRHAPHQGYTLQLCNLAELAELTDIEVIGDFRSRDVAAGGQGAPLVPAFHQAVFADEQQARVIVNIGGISNLSLLLPGQVVSGFDCGPGNMLLDAWCQRHQGQPFDRDGAWAASGTAHPSLLANMLAQPFFAMSPPKSTGRDLFDLAWLAQHLLPFPAISPVDVQATLLALTVESIGDAIETYGDASAQIYICGGGVYNLELLRQLARRLPAASLADCARLGLPAQQVEATAFAWLARQTVKHLPGNLPAATGARGLRVLGAIYPR